MEKLVNPCSIFRLNWENCARAFNIALEGLKIQIITKNVVKKNPCEALQAVIEVVGVR